MDSAKVFEAFSQRMRSRYIGTPQVLRKDRRRLAVLFASLGFKKGVEIGVRAGDYSLHLLKSIPGLKMTCVDPWTRSGALSQESQNKYYEETCNKLAEYEPQILRMKSMDAIYHVADRSFDFVYIDGDHSFDSCMLDIIHWSRKVRRGGIIAGHDYGNIPEINRAVDAYTIAHQIRPWYITREVCCTYFWENP